ncbi:MAG TPA: hypothetical protein VLL73_03535 [Desulfurivibrionaceae bacterium]|nr:hypothetical protein [Desulfurivibrionaceae bacterium]
MRDFSLLLCPDTQPVATDCRALLLLADSVIYYRALADDPLPAELAPLAAAGLCHGHTPVDLGEHQPRFRQLLQELGRAGTEFYGGALATAGLPHPDESAVWSLVTNLRRQGQQPTAEQELETVWNALLLLKLTEQYLAEEREIAAHLAAIDHKQAALFEELKGDAEFAAQLAALEAEEQATSGVNQEKVTRAWGQLFLRDTAEFPMLAVSHSGPALLLLDLAASLSDTQPVALCTLAVPELAGVEASDAVQRWRTEEAELRARLHVLLATFAREGVADAAASGAVASDWEQAYRRHFAEAPQRLLTLSALPGVSLAGLFARLTRSHKKGHGVFPHGLIAHFAHSA